MRKRRILAAKILALAEPDKEVSYGFTLPGSGNSIAYGYNTVDILWAKF